MSAFICENGFTLYTRFKLNQFTDGSVSHIFTVYDSTDTSQDNSISLSVSDSRAYVTLLVNGAERQLEFSFGNSTISLDDYIRLTLTANYTRSYITKELSGIPASSIYYGSCLVYSETNDILKYDVDSWSTTPGPSPFTALDKLVLNAGVSLGAKYNEGDANIGDLIFIDRPAFANEATTLQLDGIYNAPILNDATFNLREYIASNLSSFSPKYTSDNYSMLTNHGSIVRDYRDLEGNWKTENRVHIGTGFEGLSRSDTDGTKLVSSPDEQFGSVVLPVTDLLGVQEFYTEVIDEEGKYVTVINCVPDESMAIDHGTRSAVTIDGIDYEFKWDNHNSMFVSTKADIAELLISSTDDTAINFTISIY